MVSSSRPERCAGRHENITVKEQAEDVQESQL
jgi:hypothetical protein